MSKPDTNQPDHIVDVHEMVVDTNQASLFELCMEVYELTSWKDTYSRLDDGNHTIRNEGNEVLLGSKQAPLYTSDYLLEKLPEGTTILKDIQGYKAWNIYNRKRISTYTCDSLAEALLKLTIALSEAGEKL